MSHELACQFLRGAIASFHARNRRVRGLQDRGGLSCCVGAATARRPLLRLESRPIHRSTGMPLVVEMNKRRRPQKTSESRILLTIEPFASFSVDNSCEWAHPKFVSEFLLAGKIKT
jgi:hypothetical protein